MRRTYPLGPRGPCPVSEQRNFDLGCDVVLSRDVLNFRVSFLANGFSYTESRMEPEDRVLFEDFHLNTVHEQRTLVSGPPSFEPSPLSYCTRVSSVLEEGAGVACDLCVPSTPLRTRRTAHQSRDPPRRSKGKPRDRRLRTPPVVGKGQTGATPCVDRRRTSFLSDTCFVTGVLDTGDPYRPRNTKVYTQVRHLPLRFTGPYTLHQSTRDL